MFERTNLEISAEFEKSKQTLYLGWLLGRHSHGIRKGESLLISALAKRA